MFNFIIGLVIGMGIVWFWKSRMDSRLPASPAGGRGNDRGEKWGEGDTNPNAKAMQEKRENLEKVLAMAREKGEIRNDDVEHDLGVSNATAERYLQELEQQGKLKQVGDTGQSVRYKPK